MDVNKLLHPDLLPHSEILQILESLCITIPPDLPRTQALEIFKKVALPLPQRSVRYNNQREANIDGDGCVIPSNSVSSLYNGKRVEHQNSNYSKKFKFEEKNVTDIEWQLDNVQLSEKSVISNHLSPRALGKSTSRKIILKRTHLFENDENDVDKRMKLR